MKFKAGVDPRRNTSGRPKGSRNKRNVILDALQDVFGDQGEKQFWIGVANAAMLGDSPAMALIANRLVPALKAQLPPIDIDLQEGDAMTVVRSLVESMAIGELSPDQFSSLVSSLATALKIEEATALEERISALEQA